MPPPPPNPHTSHTKQIQKSEEKRLTIIYTTFMIVILGEFFKTSFDEGPSRHSALLVEGGTPSSSGASGGPERSDRGPKNCVLTTL